MLFKTILISISLAVLTFAYAADHDPEEVTIVEVLDLNSWISDESALPPVVFGEWSTDSLGQIQVSRSPFASNTCFVQAMGRIVPAFHVMVGKEDYLVVGLNASEELHLIPEVFRYGISDDGTTLEVSRLKPSIPKSDFRSMDSFVDYVKEGLPEADMINDHFVRL